MAQKNAIALIKIEAALDIPTNQQGSAPEAFISTTQLLGEQRVDSCTFVPSVI